jgi:DNA invertase Pin-like site-specific DNA recombinase
MNRAALYARFSSDKQAETSSEDQLRLCRTRAERDGLIVAAEYRDEAISGATPLALRPGARRMIAESDRWSVLLVESLDRISRDSAELEMTIRRLEHRRVRIIGVSDGYDSTQSNRRLMRGIKGVIAQQYLEELAHRTHRGLSGVVSRGHHAGGLAYGYRSMAAVGEGHVLVVDTDQADIVREIFARYASGESCRRIAADLNARSVPGPRGTWSVSALYGSPAKGAGILNNELYDGRYIWNRSQWVKNPDTGVRERIERPRSEWHIVDRSDLRIVDPSTWRTVRERIDKPKRNTGNRASTLLGGLLTCGTCGGAIVSVNQRSYGCAAHKDRGPAVCPSRLLVRKDLADARITGALRDELLSPAALAEMHRVVRELMHVVNKPTDHTRRLSEVDSEIARLVDAVASVGISPALSDRLKHAEAERVRLQAIPKPGRLDIRNIAKRYRDLVDRLDDALRTDIKGARQALASVLGPVLVDADEQGPFALLKPAGERMLLVSGVDWAGSGGRITTQSIRISLK